MSTLKFVFTERFQDNFRKLDQVSQRAIQKALRLMNHDLTHPSFMKNQTSSFLEIADIMTKR